MRLAGRTLGKVNVVQPDMVPMFAGIPCPESKKLPSGLQESPLYQEDGSGFSSPPSSTQPRANIAGTTLQEHSGINYAGKTRKTVPQIVNTAVNNELHSVERGIVQDGVIALPTGSNAEDSEISSPSASNHPKINMAVTTMPESSETNYAGQMQTSSIANKTFPKVHDTVVDNEAAINNKSHSVERGIVQEDVTALLISSDNTKAILKTRSTSNFYSLSTLDHVESLDHKVPTISTSLPSNITNEKIRYQPPGEESGKHIDERLEGTLASRQSPGIMTNIDILPEDTESSHMGAYFTGENFTGGKSHSASFSAVDSVRVQGMDKTLFLNSTGINEQKMIQSSKNSSKIPEDTGRHPIRNSDASESNFRENNRNKFHSMHAYAENDETGSLPLKDLGIKDTGLPLKDSAIFDVHVNASSLACETEYSPRKKITENSEGCPVTVAYEAETQSKETISPLKGADVCVTARLQDNEIVYPPREKITEDPVDRFAAVAYRAEAQGKETISSLDDNRTEGIRKLARNPISQEQVIHVNIGRIHIKAVFPHGHNEERHKTVKRNTPLSLDEYLKRRSGGSYE